MNRKSPALVIALLVLTGAALVFLHKAPDGDIASHATTADRQPGLERRHAEWAAEAPQPAVPGPEEARRLSPPSWKPPAVFAKTGEPAPQIPFPRGENAQRRHPAPATRELPENLRTRTPAVLAMTPDDGRTHLLPEEIDDHTRFARRMVLDTAALDRIVAGMVSRILAPTTGDEVLTLDIHAVKSRSAHSHTLLGRVLGEEETSDVQLVYHDGIIHGSVARHATDQHLEYRILTDGHMMVREIDPATMTAVCGNGPDTVGDEAFDGLTDGDLEIIPRDDVEIAGDTPGWRTIDVVVGYGREARIADGGYPQIEARIIASVDRMTTAFANSLIGNTELMLLGTIEDPDYVFPGATSGSMGSGDELGDLNSFTDGPLDAVTDYYTQLGADLVCFIVKQPDGSAGIAYRPGRASIVARTYMTSNRITFAHELGHNLGCDHSWGDSSQAYKTSYGWRLDPPDTARVRTIMAYDWNWGSGTRIPYFANPAVSYNGAATGAVDGYNVQGDLTADQRYYQGGLGYAGSDSQKYGFDGNNPGLGARNADTIDSGVGGSSYGATFASNRNIRSSFNVESPATNTEWTRGDIGPVLFRGGDMDDLATIQLFKGGVFHSTLGSNLNPATHRNFAWNIPGNLAPGTDYMIRVTLDFGSGGSATADSGLFAIASGTPFVIAHSPASDPPVDGPVSQIALTFSHEMDPASFDLGEDILSFTGPQGLVLDQDISGASWSDGNTVLTLQFPAQSATGYYRMVVGPEISDSEGNLLDQDQDEIPGEAIDDTYTAAFTINSAVASSPLASGGDITLSDGHYIHTFTQGGDDAFQVLGGGALEVDVLVVGGGGGGGSSTAFSGAGGGGGGAGGLVHQTGFQVTGSASVAIGSGGAGGGSGNTPGNNGGNSSFGTLVALGGGGGSGGNMTGLAGGSGGGGRGNPGGSPLQSASASGGFGNAGATWPAALGDGAGGGGGAGSAAPGPVTSKVGGNGGNGLAIGINGTMAHYAGGGGGGGAQGSDFGSGGQGGGGHGGNDTTAPAPGTPDKGGGGGGGNNNRVGAAGGSGIVIVRYPAPAPGFYEIWSDGEFANPFADTDPGSDPDGDGLSNLQEFAFGTDPTLGDNSPIEFVPAGNVITPGTPTALNMAEQEGVDFQAIFGRRKDHLEVGLSYTVQFSADLGIWVDGTEPPTVLTDENGEGGIEAVSVPFPPFISVDGNLEKPTFFRLGVSSN